MRPYWITVNKTEKSSGLGLHLGIGITARSKDDAREIVHANFGDAITVSEIEMVMDMNELEQNHVAPNIEPNWMARGVWFPRGFR
jgi:hypothetical protein